MKSNTSCIMLFLLLVINYLYAQSYSSFIDEKRLKWFAGFSSAAYVGSLVVLNNLWYKASQKKAFTSSMIVKSGYNSYRQYDLALDLNLSHIKSKSRLLNSLLFLGDMIHLPAPALEYNKQDKLIFHWLTY